jgi:hypothetical protein
VVRVGVGVGVWIMVRVWLTLFCIFRIYERLTSFPFISYLGYFLPFFTINSSNPLLIVGGFVELQIRHEKRRKRTKKRREKDRRVVTERHTHTIIQIQKSTRNFLSTFDIHSPNSIDFDFKFASF